MITASTNAAAVGVNLLVSHTTHVRLDVYY